MRFQGKISNWKDDQGFGFILPNGGGKQVFVHIKSFANRQRRPVGNELVTYEIKTDEAGRMRAENVAFAGERAPSTASVERSNMALVLSAAFLFFVAGSTFARKLPLALLGLYFAASAIAFVAYALDKSAARNGQWRTQESTLHLFALIGGWPGALAAQNLLRHKSKKHTFQAIFWLTVCINCGVLGWLFTSSGRTVLDRLMGGLL